MEQHQPREQAGFRSGFCTFDHIQVISQLQENADEYKFPRCSAFVYYEKAFDSIEFNPLFEALHNQRVEAAYITLLRDLYNGSTSTLKHHRDSDKISLQRGVRQAVTFHQNSLLHVCRTPLSTKSTGRAKEST